MTGLQIVNHMLGQPRYARVPSPEQVKAYDAVRVNTKLQLFSKVQEVFPLLQNYEREALLLNYDLFVAVHL